jgi:hypothetical protein
MYIQSYFKSGKPRKYNHKVKSIESTMELFESMNDGKASIQYDVDTNFSKRDFVYDDGTKINFWELMKKHGFFIIS